MRRILDKTNTPPATLTPARQIAIANGARYAYTGNVHDRDGDTTVCPSCGTPLIGRDWYELTHWGLQQCSRSAIAARRSPACSNRALGPWGRKRQPVRLSSMSP
ncbi:MAG: hypothetical protein AAF563_10875 [Pseudomonadota bacterium]